MTEKSKEPCWYVVHTYSGYENKVKDTLEKSVENNGMQNLIFDVRVPVEDVVEIKNGKRVKTQRKVYPGYVLVHMIETSESWYVVRNTRGVTGFVGPGSKPVPLSDEEAEAIISESRTSQKESTLKVGDAVDIVEGIFADYSGRLDEISPDGNEVTVIVSTVGRDMPIKLDMKQIRKKKDD